MNKESAAIAVALLMAGCAPLSTDPPATPEAPANPATPATAALPAASAGEPGAPPVAAEIDISEINRVRCEPVTRTGTRIVIGETCYPVGRRTVDEEALAEQLEQVRRDQEELDRRRREAEARRGPGL